MSAYLQTTLPSPTNHRCTSGTFLAAIVGAAIFMHSAVSSQALTTYNLSVPITSPWFDTGIDVAGNTLVNINASGIVRFGPSSLQTTGPNGGDTFGGTTFDPLAIYPNAVVVSLIGKIGGTTAIGTGTLVPPGVSGNGDGFVGSAYSQLMPASGRLFLGFNDESGKFGDNSGTFSVAVTVPEPSSVALAGIGILALITGFMKRKNTAKNA